MIDLSALDVWRANVSKRRLTYALLASVVATHIATVSGYWYKIIGIPVLGWPQFNGILLLGGGRPYGPFAASSPTQQFWAGTVFHYGTGICYGLIFAFLIHPLLKIANTFLGNIAKALLWSGVLATLSALLWVPRDFPEFHTGRFTENLRPGGWQVVLGIYIWHAVYGLHLGAFYNPLRREQESG